MPNPDEKLVGAEAPQSPSPEGHRKKTIVSLSLADKGSLNIPILGVSNEDTSALQLSDFFDKDCERGSPEGSDTPRKDELEQERLRQLLHEAIDRLDEDGLSEALSTLHNSSVSYVFSDATLVAPALPKTAPALWAERSSGREVSPADFIRTHYDQWLSEGLTRALIKDLDPELYQAYATWVGRNPSGKIDGLLEQAHTRRTTSPKSKPPSNRWIPTAELSSKEQEARRAHEAEKKRRQRAARRNQARCDLSP